LVWDAWNEPHLTALRPTRLPVSRVEVDALYDSGHFVPVDYEHLNPDGTWEWQVRLIGRTSARRLLTVACQIVERDGQEAYRPVTAWDAIPAEAALYREEFPDD
jgi:hypothetical protein